MCFTALEPTLSATNSTVLRSDGGWLWKKACSRSTCHHTAAVRWTRVCPRRRRRCTHLQLLLGPVGGRRVPELSRGGGDLPDDASALGRASRHKRSQELSEFSCAGTKGTVTLNIVVLQLRKRTREVFMWDSLTQKRTAGVEKLLIHQSNAVLTNSR